jgi:hypothetical protein
VIQFDAISGRIEADRPLRSWKDLIGIITNQLFEPPVTEQRRFRIIPIKGTENCVNIRNQGNVSGVRRRRD